MAYDKNVWQCGDEITAEKLNHIEEGIADNEIEYVKDYVDPETGEKSTGVVAGNVSNTASGQFSTASGFSGATGNYSHSEGCMTSAMGMYSHTQNVGTVANGTAQTAIGRYNKIPQNSDVETTNYAFIVGNGYSSSRSNAFAMKWNGTCVFANDTEISPDEFTAMKDGGMVVRITGRTGTLEHTIDSDCDDILDYLASKKNVWILWNIGGMVQRIYTPYFFVPGQVANFMGYTVQTGSDGVTVTNITFSNIQVSSNGGTTVKLADTIIFTAPTA